MHFVYNWLLRMLTPLVLLRLVWRGFRNHAYWSRWSERFAINLNLPDRPRLWIHAVSVGEVRAAIPLVRELRDRYPDHAILITTMTPTGSAQVRSAFGDQVEHCYVPYDLPSVVNRFLNQANPRLALIMETELWPNLFHACGRREIPLVVSNVRMSEKSLKGYMKVKSFASSTLSQVRVFACQGEQDAHRMLQIGALKQQIKVTGSLKFEYRFPASLTEQGDILRQHWGAARLVWTAASTREGEEEFVFSAYKELKNIFSDLLLVVVPRHPERFNHVVRLAEQTGFSVQRRSEHPNTIDESTDILVGDTMGELLLFISSSDVVYMGGSLVKTGGHNLLEPAAAGKPVVFGPHMFNFEEISRMVLECGAGAQIDSPSELAPLIEMYLRNTDLRYTAGQAGKDLIENNRGALVNNLEIINSIYPVR